MLYSIERQNDSCEHLQCITAIRSRERVGMGQPCFSLHGWCPKYAWSSNWTRAIFRQRIGKPNIVCKKRLWPAGNDANCCRNRESHSRTCSEPPKITKSHGHISRRIWRCSVFQKCSLVGTWSSSEICCTASSHHQFWRDLLHCFLKSSVLERCVALLPHIISSGEMCCTASSHHQLS